MSYPRELRWVVEVKWPESEAWEAIAAFNVVSVAHRYADQCRKGNSKQRLGFAYRVRTIREG